MWNTSVKRVYLEDGNPCISNVIEVDGSFVWVYFPGTTLIIILVPVHTWHWLIYPESRLWSRILSPKQAVTPAHAAARHVRATEHSVLSFGGADEGVVIWAILSVVASQERQVVFPRASEGGRYLKGNVLGILKPILLITNQDPSHGTPVSIC